MIKLDVNKIIEMLNEILKVEDVELKDCAIESLIDMLKDMEMHETSDGERSK